MSVAVLAVLILPIGVAVSCGGSPEVVEIEVTKEVEVERVVQVESSSNEDMDALRRELETLKAMQTAQAPAVTSTPYPTYTPYPTPTPYPTATPLPMTTRVQNATPVSTIDVYRSMGIGANGERLRSLPYTRAYSCALRQDGEAECWGAWIRHRWQGIAIDPPQWSIHGNQCGCGPRLRIDGKPAGGVLDAF